jgi:hypothetical protein
VKTEKLARALAAILFLTAPLAARANVAIEAEQMKLSTYAVDQVKTGYIRIPGGQTSGTASKAFPGTSGTYELRVVVLSETDGQPTITVTAGSVVKTLTFPKAATADTAVTLRITGVKINQGQTVTVSGRKDGSAYARVNRLVFVPTATTTGTIGVPFGASSLFNAGEIEKVGTSALNFGVDGVTASSIVDHIATARANKIKIMLNMTGGSHFNYMTPPDYSGSFDRAKWNAKMDTYNTAAIRDAVAKGVADGTIVGNSVMDEPHVCGGENGGGNTWGPCGTMTKAEVDSMCGYVKKYFPTLPVGVAHHHKEFQPSISYKVCDFVITQYSNRLGSVTDWRKSALDYGVRDRIKMLFSMNIINGGIQAVRDAAHTWYCSPTTTGGRGNRYPNCQMTADQVRTYAKTLGPYGCVMNMWRYDLEFMSKTDVQDAFDDVQAYLKTVPNPCPNGARRY